MGEIGLRHDHETRRVAVQPVDDPRPPFGAAGECRPAGDERIDEGVVPMPRRRVHHEAGRLVDDGEMFVLIDDHEVERRRAQRAGGLVVGNADDDGIPAREKPRGARDRVVHRYRLRGDETRRLRARELQLVREKPVKALGRLRRDGKPDVRHAAAPT